MFKQIENNQDSKTLQTSGLDFCLPEDPIYPAEFLSAMQDTAFKALRDLLGKIDAPKEALELLDDLSVLETLTGAVENGGKVGPVENQFLLETVANAARNIAAIGGAFYSPSGTTIRRQNNAPTT